MFDNWPKVASFGVCGWSAQQMLEIMRSRVVSRLQDLGR